MSGFVLPKKMLRMNYAGVTVITHRQARTSSTGIDNPRPKMAAKIKKNASQHDVVCSAIEKSGAVDIRIALGPAVEILIPTQLKPMPTETEENPKYCCSV